MVLLHSTSQTSAAILDELLTKWEEMGYTFGTLEELFGKINCCLPAVPADDSCSAGQVSLRHWVPLGIVLSARSERFVTE